MRRFGRAGVLPVLALLCILLGLAAQIRPDGGIWAVRVWTIGLYGLGVPLLLGTLRGLARGRFAADLVAALAIMTAMLLAQPLAGLVIVLMQSGGEALETYAVARASEAIRLLEADRPRIIHVLPAGDPAEVAADRLVGEVRVGDRIRVLPGEMIPCDGRIEAGEASIDVSRITGEPVPRAGAPGVTVVSGSFVLDSPIVLRVETPAGESLYDRIVDLVRHAQESKAPLQRLADRYAVWFTPLTLLVCAIAWGASRDPVRVLAVLVVATPCPLILATPVAILGGINRAARRQIIVRHGGALEQLASIDTAVFDKTGTLTYGQPAVARVEAIPPFTPSEVLALAGSLEHGSGHPLARSVLAAGRAAGIDLLPAEGIHESPGRGLRGVVGGRRAVIGASSLIRERAPAAARYFDEAPHDGQLVALLAVDDAPAGRIHFADGPRPDVAPALARLRQGLVDRILLLSGDDARTVTRLGAELGIEEVHGDLLPEAKVAQVRALQEEGRRVLMVGDGTNDAPALAAASVGVAMAQAGGGTGVTAEAADVVILADDLGRVPEAITIGRRSLRIARQSIWAGLGLSAAAMAVAAAGGIVPTAGALLQEAIDVAVILNALRAAIPASLKNSS